MNNNVQKINMDRACDIIDKQEALIFLGCGGNLNEWKKGINDILIKKDIISKPIEDVYSLTKRDRRDLIFPLDEDTNMSKLSIWRIKEGRKFDAKWLSDYLDNKCFL